MFLGHLAVGFASRRLAPRTNLGVLLAAPLLIDLLWPAFLLAGLESVRVAPGDTAFTPLRFVSYPITHSLAGCLLWAALFAGIYFSATSCQRGALISFGLVTSHWFLDALTHRPDLPVLPAGPFVGLGLWNYPHATILVEGSIFLVSIWIYSRCQPTNSLAGTLLLAAFAGLVLTIYAAMIFGPPPPSERAVAWTGFAAWLLPVWGFWIDRSRRDLRKASSTRGRAARQLP